MMYEIIPFHFSVKVFHPRFAKWTFISMNTCYCNPFGVFFFFFKVSLYSSHIIVADWRMMINFRFTLTFQLDDSCFESFVRSRKSLVLYDISVTLVLEMVL